MNNSDFPKQTHKENVYTHMIEVIIQKKRLNKSIYRFRNFFFFESDIFCFCCFLVISETDMKLQRVIHHYHDIEWLILFIADQIVNTFTLFVFSCLFRFFLHVFDRKTKQKKNTQIQISYRIVFLFASIHAHPIKYND